MTTSNPDIHPVLEPWDDPTCQSIDQFWMPRERFHELRAHPSQRDIQLHAVDLLRADALGTPCVRHLHVAAVLIANGIGVDEMKRRYADDKLATLACFACKLDGHTRDNMWADMAHLLTAVPEQLRCEVFVAKDNEAAVRLYNSYDASISQKNTADTMQGTFRMADINPTSSFVRNAGFKRAFDLALALQAGGLGKAERQVAFTNLPADPERHRGSFDLHALLPYLPVVKWFRNPVDLLDSVDIRPETGKPSMPTGHPYVAAYLALLHKDPFRGLEFLKTLRSEHGDQRSDGTMDAIFAVLNFENEWRRLAQNRRKRPAVHDRAVVNLVLNAFAGWRDGTTWAINNYPYKSSVIESFDPRLLPPRPPRRRRGPSQEAGIQPSA